MYEKLKDEWMEKAVELLQTYCDFIDDYCMDTYSVKEGEPFRTLKLESAMHIGRARPLLKSAPSPAAK